MSNFIQVHFLTSYPPSNLNRDDTGRPKTAYMGGATRLRISSQSLKRAWRTSSLFYSALGQHMGVRTKRMGNEVKQKLQAKGIDDKRATEWTKLIVAQFGKLKKEGLDIEQLAHFSPNELEAIDQLIEQCAAEGKAPEEKNLKELRKTTRAVDIACFGRMLADNPGNNTEAAIQVAHAITTHAVDIEDDYFTAIDDLNQGLEDSGAGHLGETEFAAGLFYGYICIDRDLLKQNLGGDEDLTSKTIATLLESIATVSPTGKQNSFASRAYSSYMLIEKGKQQPRSLSVAFLRPVQESDLLSNSIETLQKHRSNISRVYGACCDSDKAFNTATGDGSLDELIQFVNVAG